MFAQNCDYGAYFAYSGLRQLGIEVVDYPYKTIYHGESCSYPIPWYGTDKMGHSSPPRFHRNWSGTRYSEDEIATMMHEFDLTVVESPRAMAVETLAKLDKRISLPPIVMLDGEDYDYVHEKLIEKYGISLCFKRELNLEMKNVHPFPFSSYIIGDSRYDFDDSNKEIDVFFIAGNTHPERELVSKVLKKVVKHHGYKALIGLNEEPTKAIVDHAFRFEKTGVRLGLDEYLRCIAQSKIAVSVRGFGTDTIRFWEIPSYNTLLLSDDLSSYGLIHPQPFQHRKNIVLFKPDCSDLAELLVYYLENDDERKKITALGHKHLCQYHTNIARAKMLLEKVEEVVTFD